MNRGDGIWGAGGRLALLRYGRNKLFNLRMYPERMLIGGECFRTATTVYQLHVVMIVGIRRS